MDRSKRTKKTPKRFDDEAFVTPPRPREQHQPKQPIAPIEKVKTEPEVEVKPPSSIIKVKLTKRPRTKEPPTPPKEQQQPKQPIAPSVEKVKLEPEVEVKPPKSIVKIKLTKRESRPTKLSTPAASVAPATLATVTPTEPTPKFEVEKSMRPRQKRPRTPPNYTDLIPNVVLPFWDARTAAEDHEDDNVKELVHCHCGIAEESGLMVQCETCLTWQHAHCLGFEQPEDAPDGYTCKACSDPKLARGTMKWAYDQDWLTKGRMKQFRFDKDPTPERNIDVLKRINNLIGNAINLEEIMHSLMIKYRILKEADDEDPDLKLFRVMWPPNYRHQDGSIFITTVNNPSCTPASTISVVAETPEPGDGPLPDIGHLDDVSALLDDSYVPEPPAQPMATGSDATPQECRANLKLHIQQTEEFVGMELAQMEEQLGALESECAKIRGPDKLELSLDSLKADLHRIKTYLP